MAGSPLDARLSARLAEIRAADLYRVRRVVEGTHGVTIRVDGRECVNFCSNDYLGLASDPRVAEAARKALAQTGTGSGAAALVSGYNREHRELENALAKFAGRERALLFSTGWAANLGVLRAVLGRQDTLIADALNHASLIDGGRLSGADNLRVAHADVAGFGAALRQAAGGRPDALSLVVTDSVFSMDGDIAPLRELLDLCGGYEAALMIDDAHGFGVLGEHGRGAVELLSAPPASRLQSPDIYVATLGKALGCAGAFVAGSEDLIEFLIQRGRSWVFSTAPPPSIAAAARTALVIVAGEEGDQRRRQLFERVARFRRGAAQLGIPLGDSNTPIQPLVIGDAARTMRLSRALYENGYWVAGIRPPTVPQGTSRLRITLSAAHTDTQIDRLLDALAGSLQAVAA